jgi:hypothetical protein
LQQYTDEIKVEPDMKTEHDPLRDMNHEEFLNMITFPELKIEETVSDT